MATRKPARSARKKAQKTAAKSVKKAAPKTRKAKAADAVKPPSASGKKIAPPPAEMEWVRVTGSDEHPFDRGHSIEGGIATLRQRLRASPDKLQLSRNPRAGRGGHATDQLDAVLRQLGESYRDPFK